MCLAQGHNAVTPVRLVVAAPRCRVKHSTTEPLRPIKTYKFAYGIYCHSSEISEDETLTTVDMVTVRVKAKN